jgi:hypothetical protein
MGRCGRNGERVIEVRSDRYPGNDAGIRLKEKGGRLRSWILEIRMGRSHECEPERSVQLLKGGDPFDD